MINSFVVLSTLIAIMSNGAVLASIRNIEAERNVNLMEAGSNVVVFSTQIEFAVEGVEQYYYYAIAKDYAWSFVALQSTTEDPYNPGSTLTLKFEKMAALPAEFNESLGKEATENIIVYRIQL